MTLKIPADEIPSAPAAHKGPIASAKRAPAETSWRLSIGVTSEGVTDGYNRLGVAIGARDEWDRHDKMDAPMSPGKSLSLYFPHTAWPA